MTNKEITIKNAVCTLAHFEFDPEHSMKKKELRVSYGTTFRKIDKDNVIVGLEVIVGEIEESPVFCHVRYQGQLTMEDYEEDEDDKKYLEEAACATFYPYIRSTVAKLFSDAGIPPFQLPIMPVSQLLKK